MKIKLRIIAGFISAVLIISVLTSCNWFEKKITVNLNGGTINGENVTKEKLSNIYGTYPIKDGYEFAGWYSDYGLTQKVRNSEQDDVTAIYAKWITTNPVTIDVRKSEVTITNTGRNFQQCDVINISSYFDKSGLINAGYKKYKIKLSFMAKEVYDGYQYFFIYNSSECESSSVKGIVSKFVFGSSSSSDPHMMYEYQFELDTNGISSSWTKVEKEFVLNISDYEDNIYLRYGASGSLKDDWMNKDVVMTITPTK